MSKKLDIKESVNLALNPALNYISTAPIEKADTEQSAELPTEQQEKAKKEVSELEKVLMKKAKAKQVKDKRLCLLLKESTYKKAKKYAKAYKISVNELINILIDSISEE